MRSIPMISRGSLSAVLIAWAWLAGVTGSAAAADLLPSRALERLDVQRYWGSQLPLSGSDSVARVSLLDDNLYVLTDTNKVFAVHVRTGVVRWSALVADEGAIIRGPSHSAYHVLFTTPAGVRAFHRQTGELVSKPRTLRGAVIDVAHETLSLTIGQRHGVRNGDIFGVYRLRTVSETEKDPLALLKITWMDASQSKGRLIQYDRRRPPRSGDRIMARVELPLEKVKLPFAASGAAVADDKRIYVGAANQRFYSLDMHSGFRNWQLATPKTVSSTPVLDGGDLLFAGQDGRVACCTKLVEPGRRVPKTNWLFQTGGPIFADLAVGAKYVFVASSDRSLYCLDRQKGFLVWRDRFDDAPVGAPVISEGRVYQAVTGQGLLALDQKTGKHLWQHAEAGKFLVQLGDDVYLFTGQGPYRLVRLDAKSGKERADVDAGSLTFAAGSRRDQSILLATRTGLLTCLRSTKAPPLKASDLVEVLRNDRKIRLGHKIDAERRAELERVRLARTVPKRKSSVGLFEEDWLRSGKTGRPVGGAGLIEIEAEEDESVYDREEELVEEDEDDEADEDEYEDEDDEYEDEEDEDEDEDDEEDEDEDEDDEDDG
jgi:outer membrane protein assembly factor BamB